MDAPPRLTQLVYISVVSNAMTIDMDQIVSVCRENNAASGLTGAIIKHRDRFLQVLEGTNDQVLNTFERISRDTRHKSLVLLSIRTVEKRQFGQDPLTLVTAGTANGDKFFDRLRQVMRDANPTLRDEVRKVIDR